LGVQNRYSFTKVARLLQRMTELNVLDNSLVMAFTDMGHTAAHNSQDVPIVLAGGANGRVRMGRYVQMQPNCPPDNFWCGDEQKVIKPVNQLLVGIAQAFGSNIDSFGEPLVAAHGQGALAELA
jgi:hypothetical protein